MSGSISNDNGAISSSMILIYSYIDVREVRKENRLFGYVTQFDHIISWRSIWRIKSYEVIYSKKIILNDKLKLYLCISGFLKRCQAKIGVFSSFCFFLSFRNLQSRRYKNIGYASLFFSLLSLPSPFCFSFWRILCLLCLAKNASDMVHMQKVTF